MELVELILLCFCTMQLLGVNSSSVPDSIGTRSVNQERETVAMYIVGGIAILIVIISIGLFITFAIKESREVEGDYRNGVMYDSNYSSQLSAPVPTRAYPIPKLIIEDTDLPYESSPNF